MADRTPTPKARRVALTLAVLVAAIVPSGIDLARSQPAGAATGNSPQDGDLFIANEGSNKVLQVPVSGGSPIALGSDPSAPTGVAIGDNGAVAFTNGGSNSITMVQPGTPGQAAYQAASPGGVAIDAARNTYVTNVAAGTVTKFDRYNAQTLVASGLQGPRGIASDASGALYVVNSTTSTVSKIDRNGTVTTAVATGLNDPRGIAVDTLGNLYVSNYGTNTVVKITPSGGRSTMGSGMSQPHGLALDANGNLFIANHGSNTVVKITPAGVQTTVVTGLDAPTGIAVFAPPPTFTYWGMRPPTTASVWSPYDFTLVATDQPGQPTPRYTVATGSLPPGLTLNPANGALTGSPLATGTFTFTVAASNAARSNLSDPITITVGPYAPQVGDLFVAERGADAVRRILPDSGTTVLASTELLEPNGIAVDSTGKVYVTTSDYTRGLVEISPSNQQTVRAYAQFTGGVALGMTEIAHFVIQVSPNGPNVSIPGSALEQPTRVISGGLVKPSAVTTDGDGTIYVTDEDNGSVVQVDASYTGPHTLLAGGFSTPRGIAVDSDGNLYVSNYDGGTVDKVFPSGIRLTYVDGLNHPAGLALDSFGNLFIANSGDGNVVKVTPSSTRSIVASGLQEPGSVAVIRKASTFTAETPSRSAVVGIPYSYTYQVSTPAGGAAPRFTASGNLPKGLTLNPTTGLLSGTPTTVGSAEFRVMAADATSKTYAPATTITVVSPSAPAFTAVTPPEVSLFSGGIGSNYHYQFAATGAPAPTFSIASGTLPAGLTLSAEGVLSGQATSTGTSTFTVRATNPSGSVVSAPLTITVAEVPAVVFDLPPAYGTIGAPYSHTFTATGSPAPKFSLYSGHLPPGLTLSSTGVLSGTPTATATGLYVFRVDVSNVAGSNFSTHMAITIRSLPAFGAAAPPAGTVGAPYAYTFTVTGEPEPTLALTSGTLPPGLSFANGVLSGTPTTIGSSTFQLTATNEAGATTTSPLTIVVSSVPKFTRATPPGGLVGAAYRYVFATTGTPEATLTITDGALPPGLSLDLATGILSGTPTEAGSYAFKLTATNVAGRATTEPIAVVVAPPDGSLAGVATDSVSGAALANVCVSLWSGPTQIRTSCTDANGVYLMEDVAAGSYTVSFYDTIGLHLTQWADGAPTQGASSPVVFTGASRVLDAAMVGVPGTISGAVHFDAAHPARQACVYLYHPGDGAYAGVATCTNPTGKYQLSGMAPGDYVVAFVDPLGLTPTVWSGDAATQGDADIVTVAPDAAASDVDVSPRPADGSIVGVVHDATGTTPLANICLYAYRFDGGVLATTSSGATCTNAVGAYRIDGLATGHAYQLAFFDPTGELPTQWLVSSTETGTNVGTRTTIRPITTGAIDLAVSPHAYASPQLRLDGLTDETPSPASVNVVLSQPSHGDGNVLILNQIAPVTYALAVTNTGDVASGEIQLRNALPSMMAWATKAPSCGDATGCTVTQTATETRWTIPSVPAHTTVTLTMTTTMGGTFKPNDPVASTATFTNIATPGCDAAECPTNTIANPVDFHTLTRGTISPNHPSFFSGDQTFTAEGWSTNDPDATITYGWSCNSNVYCGMVSRSGNRAIFRLIPGTEDIEYTVTLSITVRQGNHYILDESKLRFTIRDATLPS